MIAALLAGTLLAVGALAYVLYPLFFGTTRPLRAATVASQSEGDSAVVALRELEFDRATGKLSDSDYAELKARYTRQAVEAMRRGAAVGATGSLPGKASDDEVEALVRAYRESRACPTCGPRPESDAIYCSNCGRYLRDRCAECGAPVTTPDARYCTSCGNRLAA
ncbi:MAG TPA: zinc ribbon domain-containing protein [Gemmatimonadaceae bacterium]|nr:zinc ribbon domain-containing protein [Gemmatimonadaceae bacterium]